MKKGYFRLDLLCRECISASQTVFFHTRSLFLIFLLRRKEYEKKKETLGLLNHRRDKYRKQQNHHSIFFYITIWMKGRVVNGSFNNLDRMDSFFFFFDKIEGGKGNSIAEPYAMHKRCLYGPSFNSIFFFLFFLVLTLIQFFKIEERTIHAWC